MSEPVGPPRGGQGVGTPTGIPWKVLVRREWGLLVLAGALTVMVFSLVNDDIQREAPLPPTPVVAQQTPEGVVVHFEKDAASVVLKIKASKSDYIEAERATSGATAQPVRLVLGEMDAPSRRLGLRDRLVVPFPHSYLAPGTLDDALRTIEGFVYRTQPREMNLALPTTVPDAAQLARDHGVACEVTIDGPSTISVALPEGMAKGPLTPDPIDITALLDERPVEGAVVRLQTPLRFSQWRSKGTVDGEQLYRAKVTLPDVHVKVTFTASEHAWDREKLANVVVLLVKDPGAYRFRVPSNDRIFMNDLMDRVEGALRAPQELHQALRAAAEQNLAGDVLKGWVWGLEISKGELPEPGSDASSSDVTAFLRFVPLSPAFQDRRIEFRPDDLQSIEFEMTVSLRE